MEDRSNRVPLGEKDGYLKNSSGRGVACLFYENWVRWPWKYSRNTVTYTLEPKDFILDGRVIVSLHKRYLEEADFYELSFARKYFGTWEKWERLCNATFFQETIRAWRKELELQLRSSALKVLIDSATTQGNSKDAQFLVQRKWTSPEDLERLRAGTTKKKSTLTKEEIKEAAVRLAEEERKASEDLARLRGTSSTKERDEEEYEGRDKKAS